MPSRYQPLADYLAGLPPEMTRVTLPLARIEQLLGEPLPRTSRSPHWWANTPRFGHARAWMGVGWYVTGRLLWSTPRTVTFERASDTTA